MAVSIADMERVALGGDNLRFDNDIGNVIELGDLNDSLGLSMLMNPSKVSVNASQDNDRRVQINSFSPPPSTSSPIDVSPLEPLEPIQLDMNMGMQGTPEIVVSKEVPTNNGTFGGLFGNSQSSTGPGITLATARDPEVEKKEKSEYLNKLQRLEQKGFPVARKFTLDNSLDEIKNEYFRLVDARQLETSIKFQRQMLMGAITGMEWLNGRFDPFDMKLDGWSESVHENVEDFDEIFEELYDKYKDRGKMSPEMRLVMAVGGSGFMCHVSNSFFRSKMPSMDDVLKKNPDLARQMAAAAANQAGPGFGNFMGMAMGVPTAGVPANGGPANFTPTPSTGAFFGASAATPMEPAQSAPRVTARREMAGPTGVDDILKTFEEVRRAEAMNASVGQPATGFATQPAVAAAMNSSASVVSADEMMSQDSAATSSRRRRKAQPPTGNTIALNV